MHRNNDLRTDSTSSPKRILCALILTCAMVSCGDDPANVLPSDDTPPSVTTITPRDIYHVDVAFDEELAELSAQHGSNYSLTIVSGNGVTPGDSLLIKGIVLKSDRRTISITTATTTSGVKLALSIHGIKDTHDNQIVTPVERVFVGSNLIDSVVPKILRRSPSDGDVGVPAFPTVTIQFSEPIDLPYYGVSWHSPTDELPAYVRQDGARITVSTSSPLELGSLQTIYLIGLKDVAGNELPYTHWSFEITDIADNDRPHIMSTYPANRATRVATSAVIKVTYSEPMNPDWWELGIEPDPGPGTTWWTNGGRTLNYEPDAALLDRQQYTMFVRPYDARDLAGNATREEQTVVFTTGDALEGGSIAGILAGDPGTSAADPRGARVFARLGGTTNSFGPVEGDDDYKIEFLPDGVYFLNAVLDSNHDGDYDPFFGDAFGTFGVDVTAADFAPDSVVIDVANHVGGIDLQLHDPSAITGTISYEGALADPSGPLYVGLFRVSNFDPLNPGVPKATAVFYWDGWLFNSYDTGLPDGDFYLFAYISVNHNSTYEPGIDPAGIYGGFDFPTVLGVRRGADFLNLVIPIRDPATAASSNSAGIAWPAAKRNPAIGRLFDTIRKESGQPMAARFGSKIISARE